jgi:hypothetical protein
MGPMLAPETLTLRATAIAGQRYADDYAVMWRGMSVGRIMLGNGHRTTGPRGPQGSQNASCPGSLNRQLRLLAASLPGPIGGIMRDDGSIDQARERPGLRKL